jgi:hypothetical protein
MLPPMRVYFLTSTVTEQMLVAAQGETSRTDLANTNKLRNSYDWYNPKLRAN